MKREKFNKEKRVPGLLYFLGIDQSKSIGKARSLLPAVNDDDAVAGFDETLFFPETDRSLNPIVQIFFPALVSAMEHSKRGKKIVSQIENSPGELQDVDLLDLSSRVTRFSFYKKIK